MVNTLSYAVELIEEVFPESGDETLGAAVNYVAGLVERWHPDGSVGFVVGSKDISGEEHRDLVLDRKDELTLKKSYRSTYFMVHPKRCISGFKVRRE